VAAQRAFTPPRQGSSPWSPTHHTSLVARPSLIRKARLVRFQDGAR